MKVHLNLATRPLENHRKFILGAALVGGLALAAMTWLGAETYRGWQANRELRAEIGRLQSELRQLRQQRRELETFFSQSATREALERATFVNGLILHRTFPWTNLFQDLERLMPDGVRVLSLAPRMVAPPLARVGPRENRSARNGPNGAGSAASRAGRIEVRLSIGASTDEARLMFLKALEEAPEFSGVQALSESRATRGDQPDRVTLELVAWYKGP